MPPIWLHWQEVAGVVLSVETTRVKLKVTLLATTDKKVYHSFIFGGDSARRAGVMVAGQCGHTRNINKQLGLRTSVAAAFLN